MFHAPVRSAVSQTRKSVCSVVQTQKRQYNEVAKHVDARRRFAKVENYDDQDVVDMREKPGDEHRLNWSLSKVQINPLFEAFRNPKLEHVLPRSYGTVDGSKKTVTVDEYKTAQYDKFVTQKGESQVQWDELTKDFETKFHRRSHKEVGYYLTHVPHLFVHDGDIGSFPGSNSATRVITDNAATELYLRNMVLPIKLDNPFEYKYDAYILHAPGYQFTPSRIVEEFGGPRIADLGLQREEFVAVNEAANNIVISSISDTQILQEAMVFLAGRHSFEKSQGVTIRSDSIVDNDGNVTLLINSNVTADLLSSDKFTLYGAHHNILSSDGLARVWGGVSVEHDASKIPADLPEGTLIEKLANGKARVTKKHISALPNLVKTPRTIVFMINDATNTLPALSVVKDVDAAVSLFVSGLVGIDGKDAQFQPAYSGSVLPSSVNAKTLGEAVRPILSGANVFVINGAHKSAASAIELAHSGKAASANTSPLSGSWEAVLDKSLGEKPTKQIDSILDQVKSRLASIPEPPSTATESEGVTKQQ